MSPAECRALISLASAIDGRQVTDLTVAAWLDVPGIRDLDAGIARESLALHRAERPGVWFEPGHALAGARRVKDEREREERRQRALNPPPREVGAPKPENFDALVKQAQEEARAARSTG